MYDDDGNEIEPTNVTYKEGARVGLPKWPAMVVQGDRVTEVQAAEIIIRTSGLDIWSNDKKLEADLRSVLGLSSELDMYAIEDRDERLRASRKYWDDVNALRKRYGILPVNYLRNSQIVSCFVGGPHGWVNWSGDVFTNTYNIGKWPDVENVADEWAVIAEAFPYLNLTCQLRNGEACEDGTVPVVEFVVKDGHVTVQPPTATLASAVSSIDKDVLNMLAIMGNSGYHYSHEMGITPSSLEQKIVDVWGEVYRIED
jgi:hypothetical protein